MDIKKITLTKKSISAYNPKITPKKSIIDRIFIQNFDHSDLTSYVTITYVTIDQSVRRLSSKIGKNTIDFP